MKARQRKVGYEEIKVEFSQDDSSRTQTVEWTKVLAKGKKVGGRQDSRVLYRKFQVTGVLVRT